MSYGAPTRGSHRWSLDEERSRPLIKQALDLGINFFDTANVYSDGTSEEIVGRALRDFAKRDAVVLATKVFFPMSDGSNAGGLSRSAIFAAIDDSLRRLGTDYVDLYQIHRWDYKTPIEETLEALHDLINVGKVRCIGASSMYAWQFAKSLYLADLHSWTRFVSMQNHYNLLYRGEEREMMPLCLDQQVGVIPWSPLARGRLTRPWSEKDNTQRASSDDFGNKMYAPTEEADRAVVDRANEIAKTRSLPPAQVALAWMLTKEYITAPIIGATKPHHLEDAVAALDITLSRDEVEQLEEPYVPHPVLGFD